MENLSYNVTINPNGTIPIKLKTQQTDEEGGRAKAVKNIIDLGMPYGIEIPEQYKYLIAENPMNDSSMSIPGSSDIDIYVPSSFLDETLIVLNNLKNQLPDNDMIHTKEDLNFTNNDNR